MGIIRALESVRNLDVRFNYVALVKVDKKPVKINPENYSLDDRVGTRKAQDIAKILIEATKKERSRKKSVTKIIDGKSIDVDIEDYSEDSEDTDSKDTKFNENIEDHRVSEKIYAQQLAQYKQFLSAYLKEEGSSVFVPTFDYTSNYEGKKEEKEFKWGDEVLGYTKVRDTIRKIGMNKLLGGWHNTVSWQDRQDYKFWKYASKFNKLMSECIGSSNMGGG